MSSLEGLAGCCGLSELTDIQHDDDPADSLGTLVGEWWYKRDVWDEKTRRYEYETKPSFHPNCCHIIFSDANDRSKKYGDNLKKFIVEHKLGRVIKTRGAKNPNSGNEVECFVWTPNMKNLEAYFKKNGYCDV